MNCVVLTVFLLMNTVLKGSKLLIMTSTGDHGVLLVRSVMIIVKVQDASGNTTQFKIKTATALKKLMSTYCERNGLDVQVSTAIHKLLKVGISSQSTFHDFLRAFGSHLTVSV